MEKAYKPEVSNDFYTKPSITVSVNFNVSVISRINNGQMEQNEPGRFHEFSVGVRVGAQLMLEMMKEL